LLVVEEFQMAVEQQLAAVALEVILQAQLLYRWEQFIRLQLELVVAEQRRVLILPLLALQQLRAEEQVKEMELVEMAVQVVEVVVTLPPLAVLLHQVKVMLEACQEVVAVILRVVAEAVLGQWVVMVMLVLGALLEVAVMG
jgi:hypothetical protein